jgi:hypothetical protein
LTDVCSNFVVFSLLGLNAQLLSEFVQFYGVFDAVVRGLTLGRGQKHFGHAPAVVAVGTCSSGYGPKEAARNNRISVCTANAESRSFSEWVDTTRPHSTYSAAYAQLAEAALRLLHL